ncbi:Reverse transcriptase (RNA-dependent DNA polymerase) [Fragilaria crotonensis]|nr:Reverse transcriptase (RNA-dependent DNA polymerase) [Fragilaria crotonensis]
MKFTGASVDILCEMNPKYTAFVTVENGAKVIYVRLIKALYGCVQSALLWYEMFHSYLEEIGFVLNPYDPCVANKVINGKQCTVAWYVDDMKISHVDPNVVTQVIEQIEDRFGKMTVTRGKEHTFLGMKILYKENGTAEITMRDYLEEAIVDSGLEISRTAATPARRDLFETDAIAPPLAKREAEIFHSVTAKLLYVSIRARMDILLPVIFLCTRVSKCTVQDQAKLKRVLEYLKGTLHYKYTIGSDDMGKIRTWVDASYAVHPDMKSHTGGLLSFGTGGLVCKSAKQKLNTKSSTEAELVGASDYLPNLMWVQNFLKGQGYEVKESTLQQDNESAIKLEKNGRMSAGQKSRHIDIRYFWIKDRVQSNGVTIQHCPTLEMLADFFTKPLQGNLFRRFRDVILGYSHIDTLRRDPAVPVEERVGKRQPNTRDVAPPGAEELHEGEVRGKKSAICERTWADVVRGPVRGKERRALLINEENKKGFVASALSRNNPVS